MKKMLYGSLVLKKRDLLLTLVPFLLWVIATYARTSVITPHCSLHPENCSKESVLFMDRLSLGMEDWKADEYSYNTQNFSGALALFIPPVWSASLFALGHLHPLAALSAVGTDVVLVLQTAGWNGFLTELSHLIGQRPRPFVYKNPVELGKDSAHYTSFYSGHTSFTAAANTAVFLILLARGAPLFILILSGATLEALILSTAYFRILAGRHFLTDVICGALAGTLVALCVMSLHRTSKLE